MKKYLIIIIVLSLIPHLQSQDIDIKFDHVVPRWYFTLEDTNFVEDSQNEINGENSIFSDQIPLIEGEFAYVNGIQLNRDLQVDGGPVFKIKLENGQIVWNQFFNTSNNDDQNYFISLYLSYYLLISAVKRTNYSIHNENFWNDTGFSQPFIRIHDKNDGRLISEYFNKNDTVGVYDVFLKYYLKPFRNKYFQIYRAGNNNIAGVQVEEFFKETGVTSFS